MHPDLIAFYVNPCDAGRVDSSGHEIRVLSGIRPGVFFTLIRGYRTSLACPVSGSPSEGAPHAPKAS